jgi:hypothetical protein
MKDVTQLVQSFSLRSKENRVSNTKKQWMFEQVEFIGAKAIKTRLPQSMEQRALSGKQGYVSHWSSGTISPTSPPSPATFTRNTIHNSSPTKVETTQQQWLSSSTTTTTTTTTPSVNTSTTSIAPSTTIIGDSNNEPLYNWMYMTLTGSVPLTKKKIAKRSPQVKSRRVSIPIKDLLN